ncbi:MAG: hypothetical protein NVSMB44_47020 [Ktedonobacteraceae bacterium]
MHVRKATRSARVHCALWHGALPTPRFLLVHHGVTHLENLYLEDLAERQVYNFLLIVTPLRLIGATGSWVHPIAIA